MNKYKILITLALAAALSAHAHTCPEPATLDAAYTQTGLHGFGDGLLAVEKNGKWGFIDRQGRLVIPADFEDTEGFAEGKAAVKLDGFWGVIDTSGKLLVQPRYKSAGRYFGGFMPVSQNGEDIIALDPSGHEVGMPTWAVRLPTPLIKFYSDDFKTIGYKDADGQIVVPAQYERGEEYFYEGMAAVRKNGLWGFIDAQGIERIAPRYTPPEGQWALRFSDGLAKVVLDGQILFIDPQDCIILRQAKPNQNE